MLGLSAADFPYFLTHLIVLLIAIPLHEMAHAYSANAFGDDTPRMNGRLSFNPFNHLDLMGSLMIVFVGFGWGRAVPVNPYQLSRRSPAALMWVSLAGPLTNFLLAILAVIPLRLGLVHATAGAGIFSLYFFLRQFIITNLLLMLFNLIPLAPLDGDKIADYFFPPSWNQVLETIRPYGPIVLVVIAFILPSLGINVFGWVLDPALYNFMNLLGV
jgi:Zn-dependent protease